MSNASTTNNNLAYAYIRDSPTHGAQTAERMGSVGGNPTATTTTTALDIAKQSKSGGLNNQHMRSTMPQKRSGNFGK